jgi:hypothetical protein
VTPEVFNVCLVPEEVGSIYGKVLGKCYDCYCGFKCKTFCKTFDHPAKGVRVLVKNLDSQEVIAGTYTNEWGGFKVLDLPVGDYEVLVVSPKGYRVVTDNPVIVTVEVDEHVFAGKFILQQCKSALHHPNMCGGCSYGHGACGYPVGYGQGESMAPPGDSEASWNIPQEDKFDEKTYWWEVFPKDFPKSESESKFDKVWDWKADEWWLEE